LINVDKNYFNQAVYNILNNAYKFTPEKGSIILQILKNNNQLKISISDSGPGIKNNAAIFDKF